VSNVEGGQERGNPCKRTIAEVQEGMADSSRESLAGAGWTCEEVGRFMGFVSPETRSFSWLNPTPLWRSRNQVLGRFLGDLTNDERRRWMEAQQKNLEPDLIVKRNELQEFSFLVVGDPGEGDASQYAVARSLIEHCQDTAFMVICSDVIYPSGDAEDYEQKFYRPYKDYNSPIYALPGNHDWYDGLHGFMYHLCGADASALSTFPEGEPWWSQPLRRLLWRKPARLDPTGPTRKQVWRSADSQQSEQRSPYFAIETGPLLLVGIDTGMNGSIDRNQGKWLRTVSKIDKHKVLLSGKPIYVDGEYHPGVIEGEDDCTVDDIVRDPDHRYVAVIGGDIHNYQRYTVEVKDHTQPIRYFVSGGGGAYMSATHKIARVSLPGVDEADCSDDEGRESKSNVEKNRFVCYPRRGDSLSFYSKLYDRKFGLGKGWFEISPDEAAAYMAKRLGMTPTRTEDRNTYISKRAKRIAERIFPLPDRLRGPLHYFFSEFFDWNDPPLFKHFLRVDVGADGLRVRCFAATGCLEHEKKPPVEDDIKMPFT